MEPVNIAHIPHENRGQKCVFCSDDRGVSCKCSIPDCKQFLHITCGQTNKCLKEKPNPKNEEQLIFEAFCRQHKPKQSSRRISSVFVMETLAAKDGQHHHDIIETVDISSDASDESLSDKSVNNNDSQNGSSDHFGNANNSKNDGNGASNVFNAVDDTKNASGSKNNSGIDFVHEPDVTFTNAMNNNSNSTNDSHSATNVDEIDGNEGDASGQSLSNISVTDVNNDSKNDSSGLVIDHFGNADNSKNYENGASNVFNVDDDTKNSSGSKNNSGIDFVHGPDVSFTNATNNNSNSSNDSNFASNVDEIGGNKNDFWWDYLELRKRENELEAQLDLKDQKIDKLQTKKEKLKKKVRSLKAEKSNLQSEVERLNALIQQQLLISQTAHHDNTSSSSENQKSKSNIERLEALKKRIASIWSDDGTKLVYANGVSVSAKLTKQLESISSDPDSDRTYVNAHFHILFPEEFILGQVYKGREKVLLELRDSDRYAIMKDLFEFRALSNGKGGLDNRMKLFKLAFRTKLNNWWQNKAPKNVASDMPTTG